MQGPHQAGAGEEPAAACSVLDGSHFFGYPYASFIFWLSTLWYAPLPKLVVQGMVV